MTLFILALATALATFFGGLFALRHKDKAHLITGFSAGAVIGVAFFDLLPEAITTHGATVTSLVALGFLLYLVLDRMMGLHTHAVQQGEKNEMHEKENRGLLRAASLTLHSLLDGVAIGLSFQVSATLGSVVAVAVLAHDFSDGINTVTAIIKGGGTALRAKKWLTFDALAPVVGIIATTFFSVSENTLGIILALFAGFFIYIGASDLIPESYHAHPTKWTTIATLLGALVIFAVIKIAG